VTKVLKWILLARHNDGGRVAPWNSKLDGRKIGGVATEDIK